MKRLIITLAALLAVFFVTGCGSGNSAKQKLFIYNWTYYIPDEVLREFEKRFNVSVIYDMYASNEEMFAKLKAGGTGYDLVFPSGDYVSIMIRENMLEKLDKSNLINFANLDSSILLKIKYDPDVNTVYLIILALPEFLLIRRKYRNLTKAGKFLNGTISGEGSHCWMICGRYWEQPCVP